MAKCDVCFRHCDIPEGGTGFCGARTAVKGPDGQIKVTAANYGRLSSLALDPIEKKPFARFRPGSMILSAGSYGCNLRCPFCQNSSISWSDSAMRMAAGAGAKAAEADGRTVVVTPEELAEAAYQTRDRGNIGIAFTYNEPLVGYEFVRDTARIVHETGMVNALVTNGTAEISVLEELAQYIDAMNIDLKGFTDRYYEDVLGGSRHMVMRFIEEAVKVCHVELTTLIVPGENDSEDEIRRMADWIAGLDAKGGAGGGNIPLHISRFFPQFHMTDRPATDVGLVYRLAEIARERLKYVYTGNC